jgi:GT2 family glycosyltransferase
VEPNTAHAGNATANAGNTVAPRASARRDLVRLQATVDDLPIAPVEVELSQSLAGLAATCTELYAHGARKALVLVRLHTHPLGFFVLDTAAGASAQASAQAIRTALGEDIDTHLAADGLHFADLATGTGDERAALPRCLHRRAAARERAPLISVIVATSNGSQSLQRCLEATLQLDYPRYEIIVVDREPDETFESEAPDETTAAQLRTHFAACPQIRYVREDRRGLAAAHNRGLAEAAGEIVAFTDDDVIVDPQWLTALAEGFAVTEQVGCVIGMIMPGQSQSLSQLLLEHHRDFDRGFLPQVFNRTENHPRGLLSPFTAGRFSAGANIAFETELLRELGGFDAALGSGTFARGGDALLALFRAVVRGTALVYQPGALVWRHHRDDGATPRDQAFGNGVGLGAYVASALIHEPAMLPALMPPLMRRLPAGVAHAFTGSSQDGLEHDTGWPADLAKRERRGLLWGPAAYLISRHRTRRETRRLTASVATVRPQKGRW